MPRTYEAAGHDVHGVCQKMIHRYYPWMNEIGVQFNLILAHGPVSKSGARTGPAIVLHGNPAAATVKVNSLKDRVKGLKDVTIEIDGDKWPEWTQDEREAVIDHELYHLESHKNADGTTEVDDCGRPSLSLRKHDFHFGGFREIALRHGDDAFETKAVQQAYELIVGERGQLERPWAAPRPNRKLAAS